MNNQQSEVAVRESIAGIVENALRNITGDSRFDKLIALRDETVRLVNAERDTEKQRLAKARESLKAQLKEQSERLRSVSVVTKPRGPKKAVAVAAVEIVSAF